MNTITYSTLKKFIDREVGYSTNTDLFWGIGEVKVYPPKRENLHFNLFKNLKRTSTKQKPHKRDKGHTIITSDVPKFVQHFQKLGIFPKGLITVIEDGTTSI